MTRHYLTGLALALLATLWPVVALWGGCKYVRPDDAERTRRAFARALVESACAPPPPDAPPVERTARTALCLAATLLAEVSEAPR